MKKLLLIFILLTVATLSNAQDKGFAVMGFNTKAGMESVTASVKGSEWAYVVEDSSMYIWSRTDSTWNRYSGCRVSVLATSGDTTTIIDPIIGDFAVADSVAFVRGPLSWLRVGLSLGGGFPSSIIDTTLTASSYIVSLAANQEVRVVADVTTNNITVSLPDTDVSLLGKKITVSQINSTTKSTLINVNGIGNKILPPGSTTLVANIAVPVGAKAQYIFTLAYDDNSGTYIWEAVNPDVTYAESDGLKYFDQVTLSEQKVKADYEVLDKASVLALKAPTGARITVNTDLIYKVQDTAVSGYATDTSAVIPLTNSKFAVIQPVNGKISSRAFASMNKASSFASATKQSLIIDSAIILTANLVVDDSIEITVNRKALIELSGYTLTFGNSIYPEPVLHAGNYKIFSDTSGVVFRKGTYSGPGVNIMWWGAKPDVSVSGPVDVSYSAFDFSGGTDNSPYFAAANNALQYADVGGAIYVPPCPIGRAFRITRPIILGGDLTFFGQVNLVGDQESRGFNVTSQIIADFTKGPAVSIEGGRGTLVANLGIYGTNAQNIQTKAYNGDANINEYFGSYGPSSYADSAYVGVGIDAVYGNVRETSDVVIRYCAIMGFNVGVFVSQAGKVQGDAVRIEKNYFYANAIGVGIGDDQSRDVTCEQNTFTVGHTAFSNKALFFDEGQGEAGFTVNGGWVISHFQAFNMNTNTCGVTLIDGLYTEAIGRIGDFTGSNLVPCNKVMFYGCSFRSMNYSPYNYNDSIDYADIKVSGVPLVFNGGVISIANDSVFIIDQRSSGIGDVVFNHVNLQMPDVDYFPIIPYSQTVYWNDCLLQYNNSSTTVRFNPSIAVYSGSKTSISAGQKIPINPNTNVIFTPALANGTTLQGEDGIYTFERYNSSGGKTLDIVSDSWSNDTLELELLNNNFSLNALFVGDIIRGTADDLPSVGSKPLLIVVSADRGTSTYQLVKLRKSMTSVTPTGLSLTGKSIKSFSPQITIASGTSGQSFLHTVNDPNQWTQGDWIFGAGIKEGFTRVESVSNDTLYLTKSLSETVSEEFYWRELKPVKYEDHWLQDGDTKIKSRSEIKLSAYGDDSDLSLSGLGLSTGSYPYPVFADNGKLANEASIPGTDITLTSLDNSTVQAQAVSIDTRLDSLENICRAEVTINYLDPDTVTVVSAGTLYNLTDATVGEVNGFTADATGRLTYIGTEDKTFNIIWTATVTSNGTNENLIGTVLDNGASLIKMRWEQEDVAAADRYSVSTSGSFTMSTNDWIEPTFTAASNGTVIEVISMHFKIEE